MKWLSNNWIWILPWAILLAEKVVKLSKSKKDDIIVDVIGKALKQIILRGRT